MKKVILILCLLFASQVMAVETGGITKVDRIYIDVNGGSPFIHFGADSLPGCYNESGAYLPVKNTEAFNRIYSTVLSAHAAQKSVRVYYHKNEGRTGWSMCTIEAVYVYKS